MAVTARSRTLEPGAPAQKGQERAGGQEVGWLICKDADGCHCSITYS